MADKVMPIVRDVGAYGDYPISAISAPTLGQLRDASKSLRPTDQKLVKPTLTLLECFLQITGQEFSLSDGFRDGEAKIILEFVGALHSPRFSNRPLSSSYYTTRALLKLLSHCSGSTLIPSLKLSVTRVPSDIEPWAREFDDRPLIEEAVFAWSGWPVVDRSSKTWWLPLYPIYKRLGREFVEKLHFECTVFASTQRSGSPPGISHFSTFLSEHPHPDLNKSLNDPIFVGTLLTDFLGYYFERRYAEGNGSRIETICTYWRNHISSFFQKHLLEPKLLASPPQAFPMPDVRRVSGAQTNIRLTDSGAEVKRNLLTDVPLHISDTEAKDLLFGSIRSDFDLVKRWARIEVDRMWSHHSIRPELAKKGVPREIGQPPSKRGEHSELSRDNPHWLANAAATFELHGFTGATGPNVALLYPRPLPATAKALGLPTSLSLIPFAILLVAKHPKITTSFLEDFEIFDEEGRESGFLPTDGGGHKLIGFKRRKGASLAQVSVPLDEESCQLVKQVIALTQPLRDYLRRNGSDTWRSLFLTCKSGFGGIPVKQDFSNQFSSPNWLAQIEQSLVESGVASPEKCTEIAQRLSLKSVRASAGIIVFIETKSLEKMAEALGHSKYSRRMIEHYLPSAIIEFLQERWIRIFQTGMLLVATQGDEALQIEATGMTKEEIDAFLSNNLFTQSWNTKEGEADRHRPRSAPARPTDQVVFGMNAEILTLLKSVELAVDEEPAASGTAQYWAEVSKRLTHHIENQSNRPDLTEALRLAKQCACPTLVSSLADTHG